MFITRNTVAVALGGLLLSVKKRQNSPIDGGGGSEGQLLERKGEKKNHERSKTSVYSAVLSSRV